ncbi:hypothetical protein PR003_g33654 [Phytophthora rubi]|uniref:Uncharacterized protein n=1 Tax=Phytophthora rubi TaxID=129364 RepID=A0A6A4AU16_9STRA|nr:hypothetical protein PR003_g33654 [Phytophthora rubi]
MLRECKLDSAVLRDADCCFSLLQPSGSRAAPSSPLSVALVLPHYPSSSVQDAVFSPLDDARIFIKPEPLHDVDMDVVTEHSFLAPVPTATNERVECLRCRQRGFEKRFRGCKTVSKEYLLLLAQNNQPTCVFTEIPQQAGAPTK